MDHPRGHANAKAAKLPSCGVSILVLMDHPRGLVNSMGDLFHDDVFQSLF